jgi:urea transport system permease protein
MPRLAGLLLALAAMVLLMPPLAAAADFPTLVQQLGADDFDGKLQSIQALGALGDPRAVRVLKALENDGLYTTADHKVVIATETDDGFSLSDPLTGKPLGKVGSDAVNQVMVNNVLRGAVDSALAGLMLFSERREDRLSAARDALRHPSAGRIGGLEKALSAERDGAVRAVLEEALAAARLSSGEAGEQLAAIARLSGSTSPEIYNLLAARRDAGGLSPAVSSALAAALASIHRRIALIGIAATLFEGLSLGSILLLAAIGLAITFGVMGVINMAHGEMIMLGAYTTYVVQQLFRALLPPGWLDIYLIAAVPVAFVVTALVGIALERGVIRFLYGRPLETLLATWGVSLVLQQLVRTIFGAPNKAVANPGWMTGGLSLPGGVLLTWNRLVILGFCFAVLGLLALVLRRTRFGLQMRAVTQNRDMAAAMGIATARVDALTFALGSGIAGMAGVALSQIGNVSPNLGGLYIVDSFMVVVFGGVGSLLGTLAGALSLGIVNKLLEPVAGAVLGKVVVLVAIILFIQKRPRGLFALKGRAAES